MLIRITLALVLASAAPAGAQTPAQPATGELYGRVTDVQGYALPGATVTVEQVGGTPVQKAIVGQDGAYRVWALPQGTYRVIFSLPGFHSVVRAGIFVLAGSREELNVGLQVAGLETHPPRAAEVLVRIETSFGNIDLAIDTVRAPITSANFLKYVDAGLYTGGRFHRATRPDNYTPAPPNRPMMELIQGAINPDRRADGFPPIPLERTSVTGLKHVVGTVSMARGAGADTARSDFFILLDEQPSLDFGGMRFDDGQGGAAFGRVVAGLDVVRKIQQQPVQGQSLAPPVTILKISRVAK